MERKSSQPLELFYCYARKDRILRDELDIHLAALRHSGLITTWHDGEIVPGVSWEEEIEAHLNTANIILLLISPAFIGSEHCYSEEMKQALERHAKDAWVVPILLRPVDWVGTPFSTLQMLPSNARPVTLWPDRDEAFEDVAKGIRRIVNDFLSQHIFFNSIPIEMRENGQPRIVLQPRKRRRVWFVGLIFSLIVIFGSVFSLYTRMNIPRINVQATETADIQLNVTRTAVAQVTSTSETTDPYPPTGRMLFYYSLKDASHGPAFPPYVPACLYYNEALHVGTYTTSSGGPAGVQCSLTDYEVRGLSNFALEVKMQIPSNINTLSQCGFIYFREQLLYGKNIHGTKKIYDYQICQDQTYHLEVYSNSYTTLAGGSSSAIVPGSTSWNTVGVVVNDSTIDLYVNHAKIDHVSDSTYHQGDQGDIGLGANSQGEAVYNNLKVWTL